MSTSCPTALRTGTRSLDDGLKCRLGLAVAVEQQWIILAPPRVQPRIAVGHAPKGDALNDLAMFEEHAKQVGVPFGQRLLHVGRQTIAVDIGAGDPLRVGLNVRRPVSLGGAHHVHIQFGDHNFHAEFGEIGNGGVLLFHRRPIHFEMALQPDGRDRECLRP